MKKRQAGQRSIPAREFKERCLALIDEVNETGVEIAITKHGRPVARLVPAFPPAPEMWGRYRHQVQIRGDVVSTLIPPETWEAVRNPDHVLDPDLPLP